MARVFNTDITTVGTASAATLKVDGATVISGTSASVTLTLPPATSNIAAVPPVTGSAPAGLVTGQLWVDNSASGLIESIDGGSA